jgi:hypothetical protein
MNRDFSKVKFEYFVQQLSGGEYEVARFWDGEFAGNTYCSTKEKAELEVSNLGPAWSKRNTRLPDKKDRKVWF